MKKYIIGLSLAMLGWSNQAQAQGLITGFGSSELNPYNTTSDFESPWTGTQTTTSLSVSNVSNQSGGIFDTLGTPINIAGSTANLQLTGALTGAAPETGKFQITLFDSSGDFNSLVYNFNWSSFGSSPTTVTASLDSALDSGTFNGTVSSWDLSLFGSPGDTVSFTFDDLRAGIAAVPEPSTYALLGIGLGILGFCVRLRRQKHSSLT